MTYVGIVLIIVILGVADFLSYKKLLYINVFSRKIKIEIFYFLICIFLLLLAFSRNPLWGTDSINYYVSYSARLNENFGRINDYEMGYSFLESLGAYAGVSYRSYIKLISLMTLLPIFYVYKKYRNRFLLILSYVMFVYFETFQTLRNYLAASISLLFFDNIVCKNYFFAFLFAIASILIHQSSIIQIFIIIISILISKSNQYKLYFLFLIISSAGIIFTPLYPLLLTAVENIFPKYSLYLKSGVYIGNIYFLVLSVYYIIAQLYFQKILSNRYNKILYIFLIHIIIISLLSEYLYIYGRIIRISFIMISILMAELLLNAKRKNAILISIIYLIVSFISLYLNQNEFYMSEMIFD